MSQQTPWDASTPAPPPPSASPVPAGKPYRRRGGIGPGIVLIAIGLIFLAAQFVPGLAWWQMWPLIIVVIGGIMMVTPDHADGWGLSRVMDGIGTVLVGLVLLGNTTGFISWGVWWTLVMLWPVFLIALGIAIIGRAVGQGWIRALSPLVIWIAFGYAVATALTGVGGFTPIAPIIVQQPGASFSYSEPIAQARRANLSFDAGAGDVTISARSNDELISATGTSPFGKPNFTVTRSGDTANVAMGLGNGRSMVIAPGFASGHTDLGLSDAVVWDATVNAGASNLNADLSRVKFSALTLKTGVSNIDLKLGPLSSEVAKPVVDVKSGLSSVAIRIPKGAEAIVQTDDGLTSISVSGDLQAGSPGTWATPGYRGERGYVIKVESGVGSVSIRAY